MTWDTLRFGFHALHFGFVDLCFAQKYTIGNMNYVEAIAVLFVSIYDGN